MNSDQQLSKTRRQDISKILRRRREGIQPEEVGLPRGTRRRTPGLRREEVATLANVSIEWYSWLEQARDIRASADTLSRISRVLMLEPSEQSLLLRLSGHADDTISCLEDESIVSRRLQALLDQQYPAPAYVVGKRWDILAWNEAAKLFFGNLDAMPLNRRNTLFNLFVSERYREILVDWEYHAKGIISTLHSITPEWSDDPWFVNTIESLKKESHSFKQMWEAREITAYEDGVKVYEFPEVGRLNFEYTSLQTLDHLTKNLRIVIFLPQDMITESHLNTLLG